VSFNESPNNFTDVSSAEVNPQTEVCFNFQFLPSFVQSHFSDIDMRTIEMAGSILPFEGLQCSALLTKNEIETS